MKRTTIGGTPPKRRSSWLSRFPAVVTTGLALAVLLTPSVASASTTGGVPGTTATTMVSTALPAGFAPASTSWTSPTDGWLLGYAPCRAGLCPALVSTSDDAQTWQQHTAPRVAATANQTVVHFANKLDGWATDGRSLLATHDGARTWRHVGLSDAGDSVSIFKVASTSQYVYAIATHGAGSTTTTQLYSSPVGEDRWQPVAGVAIPGSGGWDIATHGSAAYVALGAAGTSLRMWSAADGTNWTEVQPVCSMDAAVRLSSTKPDDVEGMCSQNPGHGAMEKQLVESAGGAAPVVLGQAPYEGITTGFATTSGGTAVVAGVGQLSSWLYASFDNGATWETSLEVPSGGVPFLNLDFQDAMHGVVVWGGPTHLGAAVYRTTDGGHTWTQLPL